jgi:hypothetical protein
VTESGLEGIVALTKYFEWATQMALAYNKAFDAYPMDTFSPEKNWNDPGFKRIFMCMCYWYATVYVVIEGWRELKLSDPKVEELLSSPNVELLRLYRNGVFHFQQDYFEERKMGLVLTTGSKQWLHDLHHAFGMFFATWLKSQNLDGWFQE